MALSFWRTHRLIRRHSPPPPAHLAGAELPLERRANALPGRPGLVFVGGAEGAIAAALPIAMD